MKNKNYLKNSIISFVMIGAILLPYLSVIPEAYAQSAPAGSGYQYQSGGVEGYMKMVTPMIPKLQGCKEVMKNSKMGKAITAAGDKALGSIKGLFSKGGSDSTDTNNSSLKNNLAGATTQVESVPVDSKQANDNAGTEISNTAGIQKTTNVISANKLCLDSVGKLIAKILIRKLTDATVKWINGGNFGDSFWPKNKGDLFNNLRQTEILKFMGEIDNPTLYPFAKSFMENQVKALNTHFAQNAQYSMNQMIQDTTPEYSQETFSADFSKGGWNAWTALTQVPANNPIGFNISASKELQARLAGTIQPVGQDVRDSLKEAGGFLGQEQCTAPDNMKGISREEERKALKDGSKDSCQKWEYVTPGKMIADATTNLANYQTNQLLSINDLNDAIAAILDAAINKWGGDLMDKGLASVGAVDTNNLYLNDSGNSGPTQVEQDFPLSGNTAWLQANPDFNIRTDITQALVDQQRTHITKLEDYNRELSALVRTIYQLDYCIPGPHPGWEQDSLDNLQNATDSLMSGVKQPTHPVGEIMSKFDPSGIISGIVGFFVGQNDASNASDAMEVRLKYYTGMSGFGGTTIDEKNASTFLNGMYNAYVNVINKYYKDPNIMPFVWRESIEKFRQVDGYKQIIEDNSLKIISYKEILTKLTKLKAGIDDGTYTDFSPTGFAIKQFSRLSQYLVDGNEVANINSLYEQAQEEKNYVWNDLLKGPDGCEQDLSLHWVPLSWRLNMLQRPPYPFPILYDYNNYNRGDILPNNAVPAIPGVTFTNDANYHNTAAFDRAGGNSIPTFLLSFTVANEGMFDANYISAFPDAITCESLGANCGSGHYSLNTQHTNSNGDFDQQGVYYFERNTLGIY